MPIPIKEEPNNILPNVPQNLINDNDPRKTSL